MRFSRRVKLVIQGRMGVHLLFILIEASNITLKVEILIKKKAINNERFNSFRML